MCRIRFLILVAALTFATWSTCQAVGSFQIKSAFLKAVTAGISHPLPPVAMPDVSARYLVGGCGRGRVCDSQTHVCSGPADIR
jgi:hypothetical protein